MNWTKAKTILIIALLVTNIFLIGSYQQRHNSAANDLTNEDILIQMLGERGIDLETSVPKGKTAVPLLQGAYVDIAPEDVEALINSQSVISAGDSDENFTEASEEFITYLGLMCDSLTLKSVFRKDGRVWVNFENRVNGLEVTGNYMICTFQGKRLVNFAYSWLMPTTVSGRKAELVSAATALMSLDNDGEPTKITDIKLVYWIPDTRDVNVDSAISDTAFPTWRVTTEGGKTQYIEAV